MKSPQYGHPIHAEMATGYGPCRLCLQAFEVGTDERLLFTYQPFTDPAALPAPGPVFIHRARCERYDGPELPEALRPLPLALEGYGDSGVLFVQQRVGISRFEGVLEDVFEPAEVQYAHLPALHLTDEGEVIERRIRTTPERLTAVLGPRTVVVHPQRQAQLPEQLGAADTTLHRRLR